MANRLQPGSSPPARDHHRAGLDGLRAVAVLLVFAFHYGGGLTSSHAAVRLLGEISQAGWIGMVVFFALSGYLITQSLQRALGQDSISHPLRRFYQRRALRILPLYVVALASALTVMLIVGASVAVRRSILIYGFFLQDLPGLAGYVAAHPSPLPLYHLWSLAVEEQFYLVWPLLLLAAMRWRRPNAPLYLTLVAALVTIAFRAVVWGSALGQSALWDTFVLTHATAILLGAALALDDRLRRLAWPAVTAGLTTYLITCHVAGTFDLHGPLQYVVGLPAISLAAAAFIPLARGHGPLGRMLSAGPLPWLGQISYGFYVFHVLLQPVFDGIARHWTQGNAGFAYQTVRLAVALPGTVLLAWVSYTTLESWFRRLQRKLR